MALFEWLSSKKQPDIPAFAGFTDQDSRPADDKFILKTPDHETGIEGLVIAFSYCDAAGFNSRRRVRCEKIWREANVLYIRGMCSLRNAERTFRVDRITGLFHPPGVTPEPDPTAYLSQFLIETPFDRAIREREQLDRLREALRDGLMVLAYIGNSDRELSEQEWSVATEYAEARLGDLNIQNDPKTTGAVVEQSKALFPTTRQITYAARRIEEEAHHLVMLAPFLEKLIRADNVVAPEEIAALKLFRTRVEKVRAGK